MTTYGGDEADRDMENADPYVENDDDGPFLDRAERQHLADVARERRQEASARNRAAIVAAGLEFRESCAETIMVQTGDTPATYYLSKDKWLYQGRIYLGGARKFVKWLHNDCGYVQSRKACR